MIDQDRIKKFWDQRAERLSSLSVEAIANLEEDPELLALKVDLEKEKVLSWLPPLAGKTILDLGSGTGQWMFRFCDLGADKVVGVEYSEAMSGIAQAEAKARRLDGVEFVVSPAEKYASDNPFDVTFISGLFVYLNDDQAQTLVQNLQTLCRPDGMILLRDGSGLNTRHEIDRRFSDVLGAEYSATYRTAEQYIDLFHQAGFVCDRHEDMFDAQSPLNKYAETRLRLYAFHPLQKEA